MEKHFWHKVISNTKISHLPPSRWGHNCCVIGEEVVFFGGYADSNYMNDVWSFNTVSMEWNSVKTVGIIPSVRSNFSMNYDSLNNRIIVFGGGGPNKKRFNSINILDWSTKIWTEITPKEDEKAPWERTYHSAQLLYPYLFVFGGEAMSDLGDMWIFDFTNNNWREVPSKSVRPCPRRFHTSALVGQQFFVIAGCHSKYRCLNDVYSMNLGKFIQTGDIEALQWQERKMKLTFLTRWGHSTSVYDGKIFIFGGRFSNDLNDLLVIDAKKNTMKQVKIGSQAPKPRRRHCSTFIGSCMLVFGGFNGEYFQDLHYINLFELGEQLNVPSINREAQLNKYIGSSKLADRKVLSSNSEEFYVHAGLLVSSFAEASRIDSFLSCINHKYTIQELRNIFTTLYQGRGKMDLELATLYEMKIYDTQEEKQANFRCELSPTQDRSYLLSKKKVSKLNPVIELNDLEFYNFLEKERNSFSDETILINNCYEIRVNKARLSQCSQYFANLFWNQFEHKELNILNVEVSNLVLLEILVYYLYYDCVIVPETMKDTDWVELYQLAEQLCLGRLICICEAEICKAIGQNNVEQLLEFGIAYQSESVCLYCADYKIKQHVSTALPLLDNQQKNSLLRKKKKQIIERVYDLLKFDIDQIHIERERLTENQCGKHSSENQAEKENFEYTYMFE